MYQIQWDLHAHYEGNHSHDLDGDPLIRIQFLFSRTLDKPNVYLALNTSHSLNIKILARMLTPGCIYVTKVRHKVQ